MRTGEWECRVAVIEAPAGPIGSAVADGTIGREVGGHVIGVRCAREIGLMATIASGRQRCVVVVDVARGADHRSVGTGERERRGAVIERSAGPVGSAVTQ